MLEEISKYKQRSHSKTPRRPHRLTLRLHKPSREGTDLRDTLHTRLDKLRKYRKASSGRVSKGSSGVGLLLPAELGKSSVDRKTGLEDVGSALPLTCEQVRELCQSGAGTREGHRRNPFQTNGRKNVLTVKPSAWEEPKATDHWVFPSRQSCLGGT